MHPGLAHPRILHKVVALEVAFTDRLVTPHLRPLSPGCQATQSPQVLLAAFLSSSSSLVLTRKRKRGKVNLPGPDGRPVLARVVGPNRAEVVADR